MRVIDDTKQKFLDAGMGYVKLELEAQLGRDWEGGDECYECDGDGTRYCGQCDGEGAHYDGETSTGRELWSECDSCDGEGRYTCDDCNGAGNTSSGSQSDDWCMEVIHQNLSQELLNAIVFDKFYYDGSVDSEYTVTIPVEKMHLADEFITAFNVLAKEVGNEVDVEGAGMHIAVLPTDSHGSYPCYRRIDSERIENFKTEVTKLLPALYFAGTSNENTRGLGYRMPKIGTESHEKYSAIYTHGDTSLEYRLFETCYDRPDAVFEFFEVIGNTLQYFDPSKKVSVKYNSFKFEREGYELARFYKTPEQLRALNETIKYVKPKDITYTEMKKQRGIKYTLRTLGISNSRTITRLKDDYLQVVERYERQATRPLTEWERSRVTEIVGWRGCSPDEAERDVRGLNNLPTLDQFIENNLFRSCETLTI